MISFSKFPSSNGLTIPIILKILKSLLFFINIFTQCRYLGQDLLRPCRHPMRTRMRTKFQTPFKAPKIDRALFEQQTGEQANRSSAYDSYLCCLHETNQQQELSYQTQSKQRDIMSDQVNSPHDQPQTSQQFESQPLKNGETRYKSFKQLLLVVCLISLSSFYFGYTILYISTIQFDTVISIFNIKLQRSNAQGLVVFCVPLGGLLGAWVSSYFINKQTRRSSLLIINYVSITVGLLIFFANLEFFLLLRIVQGMCAGIFSAMVPLIIKETVPLELSGIFGAFNQIFICAGIVVCCVMSYILGLIHDDPTGQKYWKTIFGFSLVTSIGQVVLLKFFMPYETPQYYAIKIKNDDARRVLNLIYKPEFVDSALKELTSKYSENESQTRSEDEEKPQLYITKKIALHLSLLQQFVGISAVATYGREIAEGSLQDYKAILPSILNIEQLITSIISSYLLSRFGKKAILQFGTLGASVSNFLIALGFFINKTHPSLSVFFILVALFYYMANYGLSLGPVVWMYIPDIVPPTFIPYSTIVNWGGSALSLLLFPIIKQRLPDKNPAYLFLFFAIWSLFSFLYNRKMIIETKDKTSQQIYNEYKCLDN